MAVLGWEPYKDDSIRWLCVWNEAEQRGFAFDIDGLMTIKSTIKPPPEWACSWDCVGDILIARVMDRVTRVRQKL